MLHRFPFRPSSSAAVLFVLASAVGAQTISPVAPWSIEHEQKISMTEGGFSGPLASLDVFGLACGRADVNGDGRMELLVGASGDDVLVQDEGSVYVLFLDTDGSVQNEVRISMGAGGLSATLNTNDFFGRGVAGLGDLDNDGNDDIIVGAYRDDGGGPDSGGAYVLLMNANGTVKSTQKVDVSSAFFGAGVSAGDLFGNRVSGLGDLDGDGVEDAAVGASFSSDNGPRRGAVWILFLNSDGTLKSTQEISDSEGGFSGVLADDDRFGTAVVGLGDLDGDSVQDIAVGARADDDGGLNRGAMWILFLNTDGTVKAHQKISSTAGNFSGDLGDTDNFGISAALLGDPLGTGRLTLAAGAWQDDDGGLNRGAVWLMELNPDGTVFSQRKISDLHGAWSRNLDDLDGFGTGLASLGDLDGNGTVDLAVGSWMDDDGSIADVGAAYVFLMDSKPTLAEGGGRVGLVAAKARRTRGDERVLFGEVAPARIGEPWHTLVEGEGRTYVVVGLGGLGETGTALHGALTGELFVLPPFLVDVARGKHAIAIPDSRALVGRPLAAQAAVLDAGRLRLTNAIEVEIGGRR